MAISPMLGRGGDQNHARIEFLEGDQPRQGGRVPKKPQYFSDQIVIDEEPSQFVARLAAVLAPFKYTLASQTDSLVVFNRSRASIGNLILFGVLAIGTKNHSTISLALSSPNDQGRRTVAIESDNHTVADLFTGFERPVH